MKVMGIDPGLDGAIATWDGKTLKIADVQKMKAKSRGNELNVAALVDIFGELAVDCEVAYIETAGVRRGEGGGSGLKTGTTFGVLYGLSFCFCGVAYKVSPAKWKKKMGLSNDKHYSRTKAINTFPKFHHYFSRVKDHDRAEAAMLAYYGRQEVIREREGTVDIPRKRKRVRKRL